VQSRRSGPDGCEESRLEKRCLARPMVQGKGKKGFQVPGGEKKRSRSVIVVTRGGGDRERGHTEAGGRKIFTKLWEWGKKKRER